MVINAANTVSHQNLPDQWLRLDVNCPRSYSLREKIKLNITHKRWGCNKKLESVIKSIRALIRPTSTPKSLPRIKNERLVKTIKPIHLRK